MGAAVAGAVEIGAWTVRHDGVATVLCSWRADGDGSVLIGAVPRDARAFINLFCLAVHVTVVVACSNRSDDPLRTDER